jgi:TolA-binding protein
MRDELKTKRAAARFFLRALWGVFCLALLACGGSRSSVQSQGRVGEEVDIDKLLGGEEQQPGEQTASEEDEVLRLLGLVPTNKTEAPKVETVAAEAPRTEPETPPAGAPEVERLERELQQKERVISDLQSDLGEKEKRIQTLQSELEQARRLALASNAASSTRMISGDYAQRYAHGRELYEQRKYREAITIFSGLLREDDKNKLADNAQYWIGECYYGLRQFQQAMIEFEKIFVFSSSEKHDDAQLKIALCYLQQGDRAQAKNELEQLLATYPTSEYIAKARQYLAKL